MQPFFYVVLDLLLYFGWDELANIWDVVLFDSGERRQIGGSVTYAEFRFLEFSVVGEGQELCLCAVEGVAVSYTHLTLPTNSRV